MVDEQEKQTVLDMLEADETDKTMLPQRTKDNKLKTFGDRIRLALLDAILQAGTGFEDCGINGLTKTVFDDLLAAGNAV